MYEEDVIKIKIQRQLSKIDCTLPELMKEGAIGRFGNEERREAWNEISKLFSSNEEESLLD